MREVTGLQERKLTVRHGEGCGNQTPVRYGEDEKRRKERHASPRKKRERACARTHTRAGRISVAREWGGGREQEREVGLDDIMCCYSPAECWQEDF